ncbi:MAG TPA: PDZ domain-containing protein, partial [Sphingomonas sp.]|uniref:PDZ domain-containing protein n=1 Tax=Sphingomonas sp. TaxID=28214 RepID=UPI002EDB3B50
SGGNIGIGFAIPAEEAKPIIDTLMKGAAVRRGYLGVGIQPLDDDLAGALGLPKDRGELISRVEPGEAAQRAGLRAGDVVTRVNGRDVSPDQTLSYLVAAAAPGTAVRLDVIRDGKPLTINATAGTRPSQEQIAALNGGPGSDGLPEEDGPAQRAPASNPLGLSVVPLTPQIARSIGVDSTVTGVAIASVDPSSDAAQKVRRGDVIVSVNRQPVRTAAELNAAVAAARSSGREQVLLFVQRQRAGVFTAVRLRG